MPISQTLSALADKNRRRIIDLLKKKDRSVGEMGGKLPITGPTLSHHLDTLKRAGLVSSRREGQQIIYSLNLSSIEEAAEKIMDILDQKK